MNEGEPEFSPLDRFGHKFVGSQRFHIHEIAVRSQHGVRHYKTDSFVAINEGMVVCKGFHQAGLRLETALIGLQRELGLVRSHLLVLENIAEHPSKPTEGNTS